MPEILVRNHVWCRASPTVSVNFACADAIEAVHRCLVKMPWNCYEGQAPSVWEQRSAQAPRAMIVQ
jgi:hypothetical protein